MSAPGRYIVIEGNDGTGKSTQVELLRERLAQHGITSLEFHEPAGTPVADAIRTVIKNGALERQPTTNLLLFTAARHELWHSAAHALAQGQWIVSSRNYYSTLAYQGYGEGLGTHTIIDMTRRFTDERYMTPDCSLILTLDTKTRQQRLSGRGDFAQTDTFEGRDDQFQARIDDAYAAIAADYRIPTIDASATPEKIAEHIWTYVAKLIER
ncbi:dTMP kinase [Candidatus Saccharibacteria bacterium]|nr:MAG: dTMP kinase [Candidatus Saccharibacteria bacterium]